MKRNSRNGGLTLLESLIVVAIIGMLAVMLYPVFGNLKMRMKVVGTIQRLHQFNTALQIYRQEWNGADVFDSYKSFYALGLPSTQSDLALDHLEPALPGLRPQDWQSPCYAYTLSDEEHIARLSLGGVHSHINFAAAIYNPEAVSIPGTWNARYINYIPEYKSDIVVFTDVYCNAPSVHVLSPVQLKRGIALRLSGQAVNIQRLRPLSDLLWFHETDQ